MATEVNSEPKRKRPQSFNWLSLLEKKGDELESCIATMTAFRAVFICVYRRPQATEFLQVIEI